MLPSLMLFRKDAFLLSIREGKEGGLPLEFGCIGDLDCGLLEGRGKFVGVEEVDVKGGRGGCFSSSSSSNGMGSYSIVVGCLLLGYLCSRSSSSSFDGCRDQTYHARLVAAQTLTETTMRVVKETVWGKLGGGMFDAVWKMIRCRTWRNQFLSTPYYVTHILCFGSFATVISLFRKF